MGGAGGEEWAGLFFPPYKYKFIMITVISSYSAYFRIIFLVMKLVFQYINVLLADTSKYVSEEGGGGRMGRPILSPLIIKIHKCVKITLFKNYPAYFNIFLSNKQVSEYFNALTMQTWKFIYKGGGGGGEEWAGLFFPPYKYKFISLY